MPFLECPRCALVLRPRESDTAPRHCPRCIAQRRAVVELMLIADSPRATRSVSHAAVGAVRTDSGESTQAFYGRLSLGLRRSYLRLFGELDLASAAAAKRLIARAEHASAVEIVIDLSGVYLIDSTGLSVLLSSHQRLGERLTLLPPRPSIHRLFERTRTAQLLPFAD